MTNRENKAAWIRASISALALIFVAAAALVSNSFLNTALERDTAVASQDTASKDGDFGPKLKFVVDQIALQRDVDDAIRAELASGLYSLDQPLIVVNPYGISPLSAIVAFTTEEPVRISVHVPGADALADVDFAFDGYNTDHIVPVYGLYAGIVNPVSFTAITEIGDERSATIDIETEAMPETIENIVLRANVVQPNRYQPGLNFMYQTKAAFDANGAFRWFLEGDYQFPTNYEYHGGHFLVVVGSSYSEDPVLFVEINPLGRIFKVLYAPYACHHKIEPFTDDTILVTGSEGETLEDLIYELNTQTGEIVNKLDLKTVFPRIRAGLDAPDDPDWLHLNDIVKVQDGGDILISSRNQSFVARISWPDGEIKWILSVHEHWSELFQKHLLTPVGDEFEWQYNQHSPYILPDQDNNPQTMDLLVYDNGNQRLGTDGADPTGLYTRIVHYRIDEASRTVRQIWQYGKEHGEALYASSRGNAVPAKNGNLIASYCLQADKTYWVDYREIDKDSQLVWQVEACSKRADGMLIEYRVTRMQIYNESANEDFFGAEAINLIPMEVYSQYEAD